MPAAPILIDAADPETVVSITWHTVTGHFSRGGSLRGEALLPLLRAHFLSLHNKHGARGGLAVGGWGPVE